MEEDGALRVLPKKEVADLNKECKRPEKFSGGITDMSRVPDVVYIADPCEERIAV